MRKKSIAANLVQLAQLLPLLEALVCSLPLPNYHFRICVGNNTESFYCNPTFSPYGSFIFEDDLYWIGDLFYNDNQENSSLIGDSLDNDDQEGSFNDEVQEDSSDLLDSLDNDDQEDSSFEDVEEKLPLIEDCFKDDDQ